MLAFITLWLIFLSALLGTMCVWICRQHLLKRMIVKQIDLFSLGYQADWKEVRARLMLLQKELGQLENSLAAGPCGKSKKKGKKDAGASCC